MHQFSQLFAYSTLDRRQTFIKSYQHWQYQIVAALSYLSPYHEYLIEIDQNCIINLNSSEERLSWMRYEFYVGGFVNTQG